MLKHVAGTKNIVVDTLSRLELLYNTNEVNIQELPDCFVVNSDDYLLDYKAINKEQQKDKKTAC